MDDDEKTVTSDVDVDMASMMFAAGLWHMEHAHWVIFTLNYRHVYNVYNIWLHTSIWYRQWSQKGFNSYKLCLFNAGMHLLNVENQLCPFDTRIEKS